MSGKGRTRQHDHVSDRSGKNRGNSILMGAVVEMTVTLVAVGAIAVLLTRDGSSAGAQPQAMELNIPDAMTGGEAENTVGSGSESAVEEQVKTFVVNVLDQTVANPIPSDLAIMFARVGAGTRHRIVEGSNRLEVSVQEIESGTSAAGEILVSLYSGDDTTRHVAEVRDPRAGSVDLAIDDFEIDVSSDWMANFVVKRSNLFLTTDCTISFETSERWDQYIDDSRETDRGADPSLASMRDTAVVRRQIASDFSRWLRDRPTTYLSILDDVRSIMDEESRIYSRMTGAGDREVNGLIDEVNSLGVDKNQVVDRLRLFQDQSCTFDPQPPSSE